MANYRYNGTELPALPNWDKTKYPFAVLFKGSGNSYTLWVTSYAPYFGYPEGYTSKYLVWANPVSLERYKPDTGEFLFYNSGEHNDLTTAYGGAGVIWTNTDILNEDGSVWFAASDPVPVGGEPEEPEQPETPEEPEQPETDLTNIDLYRKINGKPTRLTLYKNVEGELVKVDEHTT